MFHMAERLQIKELGALDEGCPTLKSLHVLGRVLTCLLPKAVVVLKSFDFMNVCRCHGIKIPDLNKMLKSRKFGSSKGLPVCSSTLKVICWWTVAVLQSWWWDSLAGSRLSFFSTCRLSNNFFYKGYPIKLQTTIR